MMRTYRQRVVILGTADWHQAIATNQHYVARELSRTYEVVFIESFGLRRPQLGLRDVRRVVHRLTSIRRQKVTDPASRRQPDGVQVVTPIVLPFHNSFTRRINHKLVRRLAKQTISSGPSPGSTVLWTYSPVTYGLEEYTCQTIYHCVDLLGEVDGISSKLIEKSELDLSGKVARSIASSQTVQQSMRTRGFSPVLWPNVADTEVIEQSRPKGERVHGRVVFAGNLAPQKIDFSLLKSIVDAGVDLHLAGPVAEGGGNCMNALNDLIVRGATYHGVLDLTALSKLYWTACCGIVPYLRNSYTNGVSPLKTWEYLAAGLGVVSTRLPGVEAVSGDVHVCHTADSFLESVQRLSAPPTETTIARRRKEADTHSWTHRGVQVREMVAGLSTKVVRQQ